MNRLTKFLRLPLAEKTRLGLAWFWVLVFRVALVFLPFSAIRDWLDRKTSKARPPGPRQPSGERVAWAVHVASRAVPGGSRCLPRALAAHYLLHRFGHSGELRVGVRRDEEQGFRAHAWVVSGGQVLIGAEGHERFTPLDWGESLDSER